MTSSEIKLPRETAEQQDESFGNAAADSNLQSSDLSGRDFSGQDLRGVNLQGKRLVKTSFENADLREADLRNTNCTSACFVERIAYSQMYRWQISNCEPSAGSRYTG